MWFIVWDREELGGEKMGESLKDLPSEAAWRPILWGSDEIWRLESLQNKENQAEKQACCKERTWNPGAWEEGSENEEKSYKSVKQVS